MAEAILSAISALDPTTLDSTQRIKLKDAATKLVNQISTPWERMMGLCLEQPGTLAALGTLSDNGLFASWSAAGGGAKSVDELAGMGKVPFDPALLCKNEARLLSLLTAADLLTLDSDSKYTPSATTTWLATPLHTGFLRACRFQFIPAFRHLPTFLREHSYANISTPAQGSNFSEAMEFDGTLYEFLAANPGDGKDFHDGMQAYMANLPAWVDIYAAELLLREDGGEGAVLVDVGGGTGHMVKVFAERFAEVGKERLVVQDRKEVVAEAEGVLQGKGVAMEYDFFTPQPITGARAYLLSNILHNYPTDTCIQLLSILRAAMTPKVSKLLIFEVVLDPRAPSMHAAMMDVLMLGVLSACERSEDEWRAMVSAAGLRVGRVWASDEGPKSVIEVVRDE